MTVEGRTWFQRYQDVTEELEEFREAHAEHYDISLVEAVYEDLLGELWQRLTPQEQARVHKGAR